MTNPISFRLAAFSLASTLTLAASTCVHAAPARKAVAPTKKAVAPAPAVAAAAPAAPVLAGWSWGEAEEMEESWAWRARLKATAGKPFEVRVGLGELDGKDDAFGRVVSNGKQATFQFWRVRNGRATPASEAVALPLAALDGELGLQASSWQVRALWNGRLLVAAWGLPSAGSVAFAAKNATLSGASLQPTTEAVFLSDDFMRAAGPEDVESQGVWRRAAGVWKTSGLLGPRANVALNPNPFVFRAEAAENAKGEQQVLASAGRWFWSDYAVTASVKPLLRDAKQPLLVGVAAYMGDKDRAREGVMALVDAREGRAMIVRGKQVLVRSAPFDFEPNAWHRLYFEPGPGTLRFFVDGIERARLDAAAARRASAPGASEISGDAAQGTLALAARLGGRNAADFDDVRASSNPAHADDFRRAAPGRWADALGQWETIAAPHDGKRVLQSAEGITLSGAPEREEGSVEASFAIAPRASASTAIGAVFAAQDAKNYFTARVRGAALEIVQVQAGKARLLGSAAMLPASRPAGASDRVDVAVQWREGVVTARSYGTMAQATVAAIPAGRVGAWAKRGGAESVALTSLRALGAAPAWGEGALPDKFGKDRLMKNWASNAAAWKRGEDNVFWHTGDFFGDSALTLPLPEMKIDATLALRLSADPARAQSGSKLEVARVGTGWKWTLSQDGKYLQSATLPEAEWPNVKAAVTDAPTRTLRFVRRPLGGGRVSLRATANGKTVLFLEAKAPSESAAIKNGVSFVSPGAAVVMPRGKTVVARLQTIEREKRAIIGVQLSEITEEARRELALPDTRGAVIQNVEPESPAIAAGLKVDDVIRAVDGKPVANVDELTTAIGAKRPGESVEVSVWRHVVDRGPLDWEQVAATTSQALDYTFTGAPVDWVAASGTWEVAERWVCSPEFAFFSGGNASNPTLWSRFGARGDWTLEAYLATAMDFTRGERSPTDLNLSVEGDGRDLSSGYSWIFGGERQAVNRVYRGDAVAIEKPFEMPAGLGNTHQDWFYVRLEKRTVGTGVRFRYFVNNKLLMEYADPEPLRSALENGGRFAFWTYNGSLSIARARLWYSQLETANVSAGRAKGASGKASTSIAASGKTLPNALGSWSPRREDVRRVSARLDEESSGGRRAVKITNAQSGGDWTVYVSRKPLDAAAQPTLSFDYRVPQGVRVNVYVKVDDRWREIVFTGEGKAGAPKADVDASVQIGRFEGVQADSRWHTARFDLARALKAANLSSKVEEIAFAAPDREYLRAGLGGNKAGASFWIANFNASKTGAPAPVAQAERR
jgi:hypothetical protein